MVSGYMQKTFEGREIRSAWVPEEEEWYFSVVDVVGVLLRIIQSIPIKKAEPFRL